MEHLKWRKWLLVLVLLLPALAASERSGDTMRRGLIPNLLNNVLGGLLPGLGGGQSAGTPQDPNAEGLNDSEDGTGTEVAATTTVGTENAQSDIATPDGVTTPAGNGAQSLPGTDSAAQNVAPESNSQTSPEEQQGDMNTAEAAAGTTVGTENVQSGMATPDGVSTPAGNGAQSLPGTDSAPQNVASESNSQTSPEEQQGDLNTGNNTEAAGTYVGTENGQSGIATPDGVSTPLGNGTQGTDSAAQNVAPESNSQTSPEEQQGDLNTGKDTEAAGTTVGTENVQSGIATPDGLSTPAGNGAQSLQGTGSAAQNVAPESSSQTSPEEQQGDLNTANDTEAAASAPAGFGTPSPQGTASVAQNVSSESNSQTTTPGQQVDLDTENHIEEAAGTTVGIGLVPSDAATSEVGISDGGTSPEEEILINWNVANSSQARPAADNNTGSNPSQSRGSGAKSASTALLRGSWSEQGSATVCSVALVHLVLNMFFHIGNGI